MIGILLGISVLFNIFSFGMLTFLMGQRRKEVEMGKDLKKVTGIYLDSVLSRLEDKTDIQGKLKKVAVDEKIKQ